MKTRYSFEDKLLEKLDKLDPSQLRSHIARLVGQKQFFQEIFDYLDEGVIVTDLSLNLLFANDRARLMMGWRRNRPNVGGPITGELREDHPLAPLFQSLREHPREIKSYEFPYGGRGARTLAISTMLMAQPVDAAEPDEIIVDRKPRQRMIILLRDITERRRRLAEQTRARRLASMATLTSGIAHEIKNPLNALKIHAQLLQGELDKAEQTGQGVSPERVRRVAEVVEEETERLTRTVEEFLQAARPTSPHLQEQPLGELLNLLGEIFEAECEKHGIHLEISVDPELPPVMLDEHQLLQALRNLIRNAIEALVEKIKDESDEFLPRLGLSATLDDDSVRLVVADNGPGIPPDTIEHIMEAYFTTKFGGTGLGLMVVDRVVTEHHGTLHVHTEPGQGTEFIILLPLHQKPLRFLDTATRQAKRAVSAEGETGA